MGRVGTGKRGRTRVLAASSFSKPPLVRDWTFPLEVTYRLQKKTGSEGEDLGVSGLSLSSEWSTRQRPVTGEYWSQYQFTLGLTTARTARWSPEGWRWSVMSRWQPEARARRRTHSSLHAAP